MDKVLIRQPVVDLPAGTVTQTWASWFDEQRGAIDRLAVRIEEITPSDAPATTDDVIAALALKADRTHGHAIGDVTGLASELSGKASQPSLDLKASIATPTFTGATLTLADGQDVVINAATGSKIGQAASKIGFFGVAPIVRPAALTQTYNTTSAVHAAVTQLAAPAGGVGAAAGGWSTAADRDLAIASINAARTDIANLKNFVNQIVDQLQALGLLQ